MITMKLLMLVKMVKYKSKLTAYLKATEEKKTKPELPLQTMDFSEQGELRQFQKIYKLKFQFSAFSRLIELYECF